MAPRTRSRRDEAAPSQQLQQASTLSSSGPVNAQGLSAFPDELYLEIVAHFPNIPIPTLVTGSLEINGARERHTALLSLSQTCRSLRRFFLRYLCQRIEVYDGMKTRQGSLDKLTHYRPVSNPSIGHVRRIRPYVEEVIQQTERVTIRDESLAMHVNILNLTIPDYSLKTLLPELARCISLFSNLHTVQLNLYLAYTHENYVERHFKGYTYPKIRTVSLTMDALPFLRCCPGTRQFFPYMNQGRPDVLGGYLGFLPNLEVLGMCPYREDEVKYLLEKCPNLRDITMDYRTLRLAGSGSLKLLSGLSNLRLLRLFMNMTFDISSTCPPPSEVEKWEQWAKGILSLVRSPIKENKKVIMILKDRSERIHHIE